jgi:hypothetical protein
MKFHSFAHKETGLFSGRTFGTDDPAQLEQNVPADHVAIEGTHDHLSRKLDIATGEVIDYRPPQPSIDHLWDATTRRWQLSAIASGRLARSAAARQRIEDLERSQHRLVREHCLGMATATARLKAIDDEIFSLRSQLT